MRKIRGEALKGGYAKGVGGGETAKDRTRGKIKEEDTELFSPFGSRVEGVSFFPFCLYWNSFGRQRQKQKQQQDQQYNIMADEEEPKTEVAEESEEPQPLYPKSGSEYGLLVADCAVVGMIGPGFSDCPEISSVSAFVCSFAAISIIMGLLKFHFGLRRAGNDKLYPVPSGLASALGLAQLGVGIWGIVLLVPNLDLFGDAGSDTCEMAALVVLAIPSAIIASVIVGLLFYGVYSCFKKKDAEPADES